MPSDSSGLYPGDSTEESTGAAMKAGAMPTSVYASVVATSRQSSIAHHTFVTISVHLTIVPAFALRVSSFCGGADNCTGKWLHRGKIPLLLEARVPRTIEGHDRKAADPSDAGRRYVLAKIRRTAPRTGGWRVSNNKAGLSLRAVSSFASRLMTSPVFGITATYLLISFIFFKEHSQLKISLSRRLFRSNLISSFLLSFILRLILARNINISLRRTFSVPNYVL